MQRTCGSIASTALYALMAAPRIAAGQTLDIDGESMAAGRAEFVAAFAAERRGRSVETESAALRSYPLYAYLQAARLRRGLEQARSGTAEIDSRIARFLRELGAEPVGISLWQDWLESLARRELWTEFLEHYDVSVATRSLRCRELEARIALERTDEIAPEIIATWLTPEQLPGACEPPFQWLRAAGLLDDALVEQRVRLLLENGQAAFAAVIARRLPQESAAPLLVWAELLRDPAEAIDALLRNPQQQVDSSALLAGFARLARDRPEAAVERIDALLENFALDGAAASQARLALALGLAWDRNPRALGYFAAVAAEDLDDYALQWLTRSALWTGDWRLAERAIAAMSDSQRAEPAWRYWAARAGGALKNRARARELYESLLLDDNYYSAMAAARLGRRMEPHPAAVVADDPLMQALAMRPVLVRARELTFSDLRSRATLEWQHADDALTAAERVQSIRLAARWGLYDIAVATATRVGIFNDYALLYPSPFEPDIGEAEKLTGIEANLLLALLRQESLFRPDAVSVADSLGLTQLQTGTATATAERWNLPRPSRSDLLEPPHSIRIGAARLKDLLDDFDGQLPVALAAYNAGRGAAERWLPPETIDADIWIENIPFNETRLYVRRVLWHRLVYEWLERGRGSSARSWLMTIEPVTARD